MDLIRLLLLQLETGEKPAALDSYSEADRLYNSALAIEAGLIHGTVKFNEIRQPSQVKGYRLTWEGHNFLDAARSETVWNHVKATIKEKGGSWAIEGLLELLKLTANQMLSA